MKTLLRSTFLSQPGDDEDLFVENYRKLDSSGLGFEIREDNVIWEFVRDFVAKYRHVPDLTTIRNFYDNTGEVEVVDRLNDLEVVNARTRGDFERHLESKADDRRKRVVVEILKEASTIVSTGIEVKGERGAEPTKLMGAIDAIRYIMDRGHDIVTPTTGNRLSGDATHDGEDFMNRYERVESDPMAGRGQYTGIEQIDAALRGAKRHELWLHAAFTGHLKSTFALNWLYNQAVHYKHDGLYFSLEMPYDQCRNILYALHSCHEKFAGIHKPLDYQKIRDGELDVKEKWFLKEHVVPDLNDPANNYGSMHIEVADPDKIDFKVSDIRQRAELLYSKSPFATIFIDHALLIAPRKWVPSTTERLNECIRDLKKMAMSFNRGMGMAVVLLFQISREGFRAGEKVRKSGSDHVYNVTFLSYANEAERSSDIVTATWLDDDLSKQNQALFQCLKSRDQKPFDPFKVGIYWPCRRLKSLHDVSMADAQKAGDDIDLAAEVAS